MIIKLKSAYWLLVFPMQLFLSNCMTGYNQKEKELFNNIKLGMRRNKVIEILGKPDTVVYSIIDSSEYEFIYFSKNKFGWSTVPKISFDSTDTVIFYTYGDTE